MKKVKSMAASLTIGLLLCAFGMGGVAFAGEALTAGAVEKMIEQADQARQKAGAVNGEWRDTGKMIKGAQKALAAGDLEGAAKMAKKAQQQGELGYDQAVVQQQKFKMPGYIKY